MRGRSICRRPVCLNPAYAAYYAKTACSPNGVTPAQMAAGSRISPEEKAIFREVRHAYNAGQNEIVEAMRKGLPWGTKAADLVMSTYRPQNDKIDLDLYNGAITWGTYNKRRLEINSAYSGAASQLGG
jgi:hypothetical protein